MMKLVSLFVLVGVFITSSNGQWPLGQDFYIGMNQMVSDINNMQADMQATREQMAIRRRARINDDSTRAWEGAPFGPGGSVFITADGGLGYAYNSTDGSYTLYSLSPGSPPTGYMYHLRAQGGTSFHSW